MTENKAEVLKKQIVLQQKALIQSARTDLRALIKVLKPEYKLEWAYEIVIDELENLIFSDDIHRLMIFAPPRWGKSTISSIFFPIYCIGALSQIVSKDEGSPFKILCGSYSPELAEDFSTSIQTYMESDQYKAIYPNLALAPRGGKYGTHFKRSNENFDILCDSTPDAIKNNNFFNEKITPKNLKIKKIADYKIIHKSGIVTGRGSNLGILDDMVKTDRDVESKSLRDALFRWYNSTFYTRFEDFRTPKRKGMPGIKYKQLMLMTRWHEDDLPGRVLSETEKYGKDYWRTIYLPAEGYPIHDTLRHPRDKRKEGELLSNRFSIVDKKKNLSNRQYWSLFQQKPFVETGEIIKDKWFQYYSYEDIKPLQSSWDLVIGGADLSFDSLEEGSYCVYMRAGIILKPLKIYILKLLRDKYDFSDQLASLRHFINENKDYTGGFFLEKAANANAIYDQLGPTRRKKRARDEYDSFKIRFPFIELDTVKDSKTVRLESILYLFKYGHIFLPKPEEANWVNDYISELKKFPNGKNDDQVDCTSLILRQIKKRTQEHESFDNLSQW